MDENAKRGFFDYYDTDTNIIMLHEAICSGTGNALKDAMLIPHTLFLSGGETEGWISTLIDCAKNETPANETYARYWHGYLIFLKPLFYFFTLEQIYWINGAVLLFLVLADIYLLYRRLGRYALAYIFAVALMNPLHIVKSFQLSAVFYAMNLMILLLMLFYSKQRRGKMIYVFAAGGMWVAYFDFLTYPLVAFAIPLLFFILLNRQAGVKRQFFDVVGNAAAFLVGYGGLWSLKWVLASILTEENVIKDGLFNVLHRVGVAEWEPDQMFLSEITRWGALKYNFSAFFTLQTAAIIGIFLIVLLCGYLWSKGKFAPDLTMLFWCAVVAVSPIAWYLVVYNHCALHPHLEWREAVILPFAVAVALLGLIRTKEKSVPKK